MPTLMLDDRGENYNDGVTFFLFFFVMKQHSSAKFLDFTQVFIYDAFCRRT
jgi:hypothetical protein